jgi:hypothetical protein
VEGLRKIQRLSVPERSLRVPLLGPVLRFLLGCLLWPLAGVLWVALTKALWALPWQNTKLLAFGGGALAYGLLQVLVSKPLFFYVLGHELTHAMASWLQGGRADDLQVSTSKGGSVKVSRSNALVALAPYLFPLYTFMVLGIVLVFDPNPSRLPLILFLYGFTLAFHGALTLHTLAEHQSDLEEVGWFLAIPLILCVNAIVVVLILSLSFPEAPSFLAFLKAVSIDSWSLVLWARSLF